MGNEDIYGNMLGEARVEIEKRATTLETKLGKEQAIRFFELSVQAIDEHIEYEAGRKALIAEQIVKLRG